MPPRVEPSCHLLNCVYVCVVVGVRGGGVRLLILLLLRLLLALLALLLLLLLLVLQLLGLTNATTNATALILLLPLPLLLLRGHVLLVTTAPTGATNNYLVVGTAAATATSTATYC